MANERNLKPPRSTSEARERGAKGGKASGEARRRKRTSREVLEMLNRLNATEQEAAELARNGVPKANMTRQVMRLWGLQKKAESGDVAANRLILEVLGELNAPTIPDDSDSGFTFKIEDFSNDDVSDT